MKKSDRMFGTIISSENKLGAGEAIFFFLQLRFSKEQVLRSISKYGESIICGAETLKKHPAKLANNNIGY